MFLKNLTGIIIILLNAAGLGVLIGIGFLAFLKRKNKVQSPVDPQKVPKKKIPPKTTRPKKKLEENDLLKDMDLTDLDDIDLDDFK